MCRRSAIVAVLGLLLALGLAAAASAGQIQPGDLIVTDFGNGTLVDVNPVSGASFVIASGFSNPQGVAINAQGTIFVSDIGPSTIDEVNPTTGVVTTFSGNGVGTGPALNRPFEMSFSSGTLYVAEGGTPNGNTTAVYAIDANGNRTVLAGNNGSSNNLFKQFLAGLAVRLERESVRLGAHRGHDLSSRLGDRDAHHYQRPGPPGPCVRHQRTAPRG